jgi:hypothetical protein
VRTEEVLRLCDQILTEAGINAELQKSNFLDYADLVRDAMGEWDKKALERPWVRDFAEGLRRSRDDFEEQVRMDPMLIYKPAHSVALDFHTSTAFIRYARSANRTAKTQSAVFDNYACLTGHNPYRTINHPPNSIFIVGVDYSNYAPEVFEKKYVYGEPGNPLSPAFPEGGKWFYKYNTHKHILTIACSECAEKGKAGSCKHEKSTLHLFSDYARQGEQAIAGGQYAQGQFDEHVSSKYFFEAITRLESVPYSSLMVTGTPLQGKGAWEHQKLTLTFEKGQPENSIPSTDRLYVSLHTIDQFSAGLAAPELIEAKMKVMSPAEQEARVWGRPAAFSETAVFDSWEVSNMYEDVCEGEKGFIFIDPEDEDSTQDQTELLLDAQETTQTVFMPDESGMVEIWEQPKPHCQYVIGADVARGLRDGDYSCGSVLKVTRKGDRFHFDLVAQHHGWINPEPYADDLMRLAMFYNSALLIVERRGPGDRTLQRLKELDYWNLFRDLSDPSTAQFSPDALLGIDTNVKSKGIMVSVLQQCIKDRVTGERSITIHSYLTLEEIGHYGQDVTDQGTVRFRGESGHHDDRVMSLVLAVYAVKAYPEIYDLDTEVKERQSRSKKRLDSKAKQFWEDIRAEMEEDARSNSDPYY